MKAKIFIVPLLIAIMIGMVIWAIAPDYSVMQTERKNLKAAEKKLSDMREKNRQAVKLGLELENSAEQKNVLLKYIPPTRQEEEMINSLYTLASAESLTVSNLAFIPGNNETAAIPVDATYISGAVPVENAVIAPAKPTPGDFQINIGVLGGYEKIRAFLNKAATLKRFNNANSVKIAEVSSSANLEESPVPSGSLQADLTFSFKYFAKDDLFGVNADSSIFSSGKFDMDVISGIRSKVNTEILGINADSAGRNNPFLP